jgi:hypothetical protein
MKKQQLYVRQDNRFFVCKEVNGVEHVVGVIFRHQLKGGRSVSELIESGEYTPLNKTRWQ